RWFPARPLTMGLHHVEPAELADPFVAFPDLLADIPRTASNLPLVDARVAAERAARVLHGGAAPAADSLPRLILIRSAPASGCDDSLALKAHAGCIGCICLPLQVLVRSPSAARARTATGYRSTDRASRNRSRRPCARSDPGRTCTSFPSRSARRA